jgi:hypothetical protein
MPISELHIAHLGGIPRDFETRFGGGREPASMMLFGDNGTGKSSIVDSIEFGLQGRMDRVSRPDEVLRMAQSLATERRPIVRLKLDTGEEIERTFAVGRRVQIVPSEPHAAYCVAPVALRRRDVTRFWDTSEAQRQVLFRGFFEGPERGGWMRLGDEDERRLREQRLALKRERRTHLTTLLESLDRVAYQVPLDSLQAFDTFIRDFFAGTFGRNWPTSGPSDDPDDRRRFEAAVAIRRLSDEILDVQRRLRTQSAGPVGQTALGQVLGTAGAELATAFSAISDVSFVNDISLQAGGEGDVSLSIRLQMPSGTWVAPELVLSEANLDLLALLVFTSIARGAAEHGQEKLLVLDDVVQSVDATIRTRFFEYLVERFSEWQLIVTTHDRLWREQALDILRRQSKQVEAVDIVGWSFATGPVARGYAGSKIDRLAGAIAGGDEATDICSRAGGAFEEICHQLSWRLKVRVARSEGDRYTLGDLWPPIADRLSEIGGGAVVENVDRSRKLRNLVGAHYVEWAQSLSDREARDFGNAVVELAGAVRCSKCGGWIRRTGSEWACGCGATVMRKA